MNRIFAYISKLKSCFYQCIFLESKYLNLLGVIFLTISGNFIYNFLIHKSDNYVYIFFGSHTISQYILNNILGISFVLLGSFFLYLSYIFRQLERDFSKIKFQNIKLKKYIWKKNRIRSISKIIMYIFYFYTLLILSMMLMPFHKKIFIQKPKAISFYKEKNNIMLREIYARKNHYYTNQFSLLKFFIQKDSLKIDTLSIIDISSGSGNFVEMVKDSFPKIFVLGSDGDVNSINYSKEKLKKKNYEYLIINKPVLWQDLTSNKILTSKKYDFVFLLGNSIPNLQNYNDLPYVFIEINKILKNGGILLLDYNNKIDINKKLNILSNSNGIECIENFEKDEKYITQTISVSNRFENKDYGKFSIKLNKDCLNKQNLINNLKIAGFNVISDPEFSKHYNCSDLTLIVAQKK